jgi:hypothetical protein
VALNEDVIVKAPGVFLEVECTTWYALVALGLAPDIDQYGRPLPEEAWKQSYAVAMLDADRLRVTLAPVLANAFADGREFYSASIPEQEDIGEVLDSIDREVDGVWKKFAVTSKKGWVETDDVDLVFLDEGKEIIHRMIELCRCGEVKVELARLADPNPGLKVVR